MTDAREVAWRKAKTAYLTAGIAALEAYGRRIGLALPMVEMARIDYSHHTQDLHKPWLHVWQWELHLQDHASEDPELVHARLVYGVAFTGDGAPPPPEPDSFAIQPQEPPCRK